MFEIVIASFKLLSNLKKSKFFQKSLLLADTSIDIILRIFFSFWRNINIVFVDYKFI